jgi:uncharacterized membrane protein YeaQ/YmgE (transglycosylase-associated protein family)
MDIVRTFLIGLIVGVVARALHRGEDKMGVLATSLLGIGGSVVATFAGQALHLYRAGETAGFLGATLGAILLLVIGGALRRARRAS